MRFRASGAFIVVVLLAVALGIGGSVLASAANGPIGWAAAGLVWWLALMVLILGGLSCVIVVGRRFCWASGERLPLAGISALAVNRQRSGFIPVVRVLRGTRAEEEITLSGFRRGTLEQATADATRIADLLGVSVVPGEAESLEDAPIRPRRGL